MIWCRKKQKKKNQIMPVEKTVSEFQKPDFTKPIEDQEEVELVSLLASIVASGNLSDASFKVKSVRGVDLDKEAAAVVVAAVLAGDKPESTYRLVRIEERD